MARRNPDRGQQMYKDAPEAEADWDKVSPPRSGGSASPKRDIIALRAPPSETPLEAERPAEPAEKAERPTKPVEKEAKPGQQPDAQQEKPSEKPRKGFLRRRPILSAVGLIALLLAAAAGYLYWDQTAHFEFDRRRLHRGAPVRDRAPGRGLRHRGAGHRQRACQQGRRGRPDRPARLSRGARAGRRPSGGGASRHPKHRCADRYPRRADRREQGAGGPGAGEYGTLAGHLGTRQAPRQKGLGDGAAGHH